MTQTIAKLVFTGTRFVAVYKLAEILGEAMSRATGEAFEAQDTSLTQVEVQSAGWSAHLDVGFEDETTVVTLGISLGEDLTATQALLARLTYAMASALPVEAVRWPGADISIPRDTFLEGLTDTMEAEEAEALPIVPRRVPRATARPERRRARMGRRTLPMTLADCPVHRPYVEELHREAMLADASAEEIDAIRADLPEQTTAARLSTWAVSLSVATLSPAVAVPLIVHNVVRGEDFRVASLAMAVGGLFLTLSSSGAMAALPLL